MASRRTVIAAAAAAVAGAAALPRADGSERVAAATTTVLNSSVTARSRIFMTARTLGTVSVPSALCASSRTAGRSFTVTPSVPTDTSVIAYEIFEPGAPTTID